MRVTDFKERMFDLNETINWKPKATGEGRFGNWLKNANDWNLSRSRYWGIPLPIWRTADKQEEICIPIATRCRGNMESTLDRFDCRVVSEKTSGLAGLVERIRLTGGTMEAGPWMLDDSTPE